MKLRFWLAVVVACALTTGVAGVHAAGAAGARTITDPGGDASGQPKLDIVSSSVDVTSSQFVFKARMATPSDVRTDPFWKGDVLLGWSINGSFDGRSMFAAIAHDESGNVQPLMYSVPAADVGCEGIFNFDGTTIMLTFVRAQCPGVPTAFTWSMLTISGSAGDGIVDQAPDHGEAAATPVARAGYFMADSAGRQWGFGNAAAFASISTSGVTGIALRSDGTGSWLVDGRGHIFTSGRAKYFGGTTPLPVGERVVGIAATPTDNGYWLVTNKGRVFARGGAEAHGDPHATMRHDAVALVATPTGHGYYVVARDGGVFTFGDAHYRGSTGSLRLKQPIVGVALTPNGAGYWLIAGDGGVFSFNAPFRGSLGALKLRRPIVGGIAYGNGYLLTASDGGVFDFSNKPYLGSLGGNSSVPAPIVGIAAYSVTPA